MKNIHLIEREFLLEPSGLDESVKAVAERMTTSDSFTYNQESMIRHSMVYTSNVELRKSFAKGLMKMALKTLTQPISPQRLNIIRKELYRIAET